MNSQLSDQLEPYWEHLDGLIEEDIKKTVSSANYKYFDACRFKIKALWYIHSRVGDLDARYGQLIDEFIARREYERFSHNQDGTWSYFPFFESLEFENLLNQGKACLDCFSKAVGSAFGELPNNLSKLETVLKTKAKSTVMHKVPSYCFTKFQMRRAT